VIQVLQVVFQERGGQPKRWLAFEECHLRTPSAGGHWHCLCFYAAVACWLAAQLQPHLLSTTIRMRWKSVFCTSKAKDLAQYRLEHATPGVETLASMTVLIIT
jgi:hypothetical protein